MTKGTLGLIYTNVFCLINFHAFIIPLEYKRKTYQYCYKKEENVYKLKFDLYDISFVPNVLYHSMTLKN